MPYHDSMTQTSGSGMTWLKYGCFGCLGAIGLVVAIGAGVAGLATYRARSIEYSERTLSPELPEASAETEPVPVTPEALAADLPRAVEPSVPPQAGRVVLRLSNGDFHVQPAEAGERLRVEASYDERSYRLEESLEMDLDGKWTYRVSFERSASAGFLTTLTEMISGKSAKVQVFLPPDVPIDLVIEASQGGSRVNLGGLWIRSADLDFSMGGFDFMVAEPLRAPADRIVIRTSMGGGVLRSLGNASPHQLEVDHSMGGLFLDLGGRWENDAEITLKSSMGGGDVRLPSGAIIEGLSQIDREPSGGAAAGAPTLTFSVSSTAQLDFSR